MSVPAFWAWWNNAADGLAADIDAGRTEDRTEEISNSVQALHPDLQWELTPGISARHALVISGGGVPELRTLAERVITNAPPANGTWEYRPARISDPDVLKHRLDFGPTSLFLSEARLGI
jgi:hypothetical protein